MKPSNKTPEGKKERTNKMKKNVFVLLGITTALVTSVAVAACATKKNQVKTQPQIPHKETTITETTISDDGQNPVMNFIGNYYGGRACVTVEAKGSDKAEITVVWGDSYNTKAVWTMSGTFNEATTSVFYDNAIKKMITLNEKGEVIFEEYLYTSGRGEFVFSYDGVTWDDQNEHIADNMVFKYGDSAEGVLATDPTEYIPETSESAAASAAATSAKLTETEKPKETEKPAETKETEPATTVPEPAHKTAAEISGTYVSGRATATVDASDPDNVSIRIVWSESADTTVVWRISGRYNEETETILYDGCVKKVLTYADDGETELEEVSYTDGSGAILFSYDGFTWSDYNENIAENMVFIKEA